MTYISFTFYIFLASVLICYYVVPLRIRWIVLLIGSIVFYFLAYRTGWWIFLLSIVSTYGAGLLLEGFRRRRLKRFGDRVRKGLFFLAILSAAMPWFLIKNGNFVLRILHRAPYSWITPLGISFYTLQAVAYLTDIYKGGGGTCTEESR